MAVVYFVVLSVKRRLRVVRSSHGRRRRLCTRHAPVDYVTQSPWRHHDAGHHDVTGQRKSVGRLRGADSSATDDAADRRSVPTFLTAERVSVQPAGRVGSRDGNLADLEPKKTNSNLLGDFCIMLCVNVFRRWVARLLGYYLSHYITAYLLFVCLWCVCVANKFDRLIDWNRIESKQTNWAQILDLCGLGHVLNIICEAVSNDAPTRMNELLSSTWQSSWDTVRWIDWVSFNVPPNTLQVFTGQITQPTASKHWRNTQN